MEGSAAFLQQLTDALSRRGQWLEGTQIPRLREAIQSYQTLFESIMGMLIRKGLLREDPYNYEQTQTDIVVPSDAPLPDFENADETSYRLAAFRRQLKFVLESVFTLGELKLGRLKKLAALVSYINWGELAETSGSPVTRSFARAFMKILLGPDAMSAQILKDQEMQIERAFQDCRSIIADVVTYHRESWKAELRRVALPHLSLEPGASGKKDETVRLMRKIFSKEMEGRPWYPALAQELFAEETESDAESRKARLLASLSIPEAQPAQKSEVRREGKPILMEAVRILSRPYEELVTAIESLSETERLLLPREGGFGQTLRRLFGMGARAKTDSHTYEITFTEPARRHHQGGEAELPAVRAGSPQEGYSSGRHFRGDRSCVQAAGRDVGDLPCRVSGQATERASPDPPPSCRVQCSFSVEGCNGGKARRTGNQAGAARHSQQPRESESAAA